MDALFLLSAFKTLLAFQSSLINSLLIAVVMSINLFLQSLAD